MQGERLGPLSFAALKSAASILALDVLVPRSHSYHAMIQATLAVLALALLSPSAEAAGDPRAGKAAFDRKCASCHKVGPGARSGFGPQLNGIVGRKAGAASDYPYSNAMRGAGIVWSDNTLAAFLRAPEQVVPGNKMRFWGIGSARQIDDLLAYLRQFQ